MSRGVDRDDLEAQRTRIDRIEQQAVEEFNNHMDEVLELLGYENLARIWIERVEQTVREGRRNVEKTAFELHVVRMTESGATYEDTIDHLSESEREVTGLTFALAGYLVHNVHETVPFMVLDSIPAGWRISSRTFPSTCNSSLLRSSPRTPRHSPTITAG